MRRRPSTGLLVALVIPLSLAAVPAAAQSPAANAEWLSLCGHCPSPTVFRKSGAGTAHAVAEARMAKDAVTHPDGPCPHGEPACVARETKRVYRASADCASGTITAVDGASYTLAGLWDDSDIGGGRTMWRGADGVVVGRDHASGGLSIAQQWEVLCPGRVSARLLARAAAAPPAAGTGGARDAAEPRHAPVCAAEAPCAEVNRFAMSVEDFRASLAQPTKVLATTARFHNKSGRPVVLAYVAGSGAAIDERGNRYALDESDVRGIGIAGPRAVDDKFVLAPGDGGDARFTFVWGAGRALYGTVFDIELTVREVIPQGNGQVRLGAEHPLRIAGLRDGARAATRAQAPAPASAGPAGSAGSASAAGSALGAGTGATAAAAAAESAPAADPCGGRAGCYFAGPFTVSVAGFSAAMVNARHHGLRLNLAIRNTGAQPLILAYRASTSAALDDLGNAYTWGRPGTHDTSVQGIGILEGPRADTSFVLRPGESRMTAFNVIRFEAGARPKGSSFTFDTVLSELRILPNGTQSETVREHSVHLAGVSAATAAAGGAAAAGNDLKKAADAIKGLFKRKKQ